MAAKTKPFYKQTKFVLPVILALVAVGAWLYVSQHNHPAKGVTPDSAAGGGNAAKTRLSESSPTPAPSTPTPTTTPASTGSGKTTPTPTSGRYITSFSITTRPNGFHVASVITGLASGTCQIVITPTGGSQISKTGSVVVSGTTSMCSFGGDIPGSGTSGNATLTVTAGDGSSDHMEATF